MLGSTWTSPLRWSIFFGSSPIDRSGLTATSLPNASRTLFAVGVLVLSVSYVNRPPVKSKTHHATRRLDAKKIRVTTSIRRCQSPSSARSFWWILA